MTTFASQETFSGFGSTLIFDTSGNLYWSICNYYNGSSFSQTSYVFKITPDGTKTTFASQATIGATGSDLAFDTSGNLYWAVCNNYNGITYSQTSYVYKITPAGTKTTFASQFSAGARDTALAFDEFDNLFWAISNHYDGATYSQQSNVYRITPAGIKIVFADAGTVGALGTDLIFDINGNLYWAIANLRSGTNSSDYLQTSHIFKITSDGSMTPFASCKTQGASRTALTFDNEYHDNNGNLYWAIACYGHSSAPNATSFVYKITPIGTKTTFASEIGFGANGTALTFDSNNNLYWALINYGNGSTWNHNSYVYVKSL